MKLYTMEFEIPLMCLLLIILLMVVYFSKQKINTLQNKVFKVMLYAAIIEVLLDFIVHLICSFTPFSLINAYPLYDVFNFINKFIVVSFVAIFECLFLYVLVITYGKNILNNKKIMLPVSIINVISLICLIFTNIEIVNAGTASNVLGSTPMVGYMLIALFLSGSMIVTVKNSKKIDQRYLPIIIIFIVMIICYVVTLFFSGIILYDFAIVILCYLMFFTIENPDMKLLEEVHKSKEISDNANEEKTMFLYNMTQEIRNTTNDINMNADMILDSDNLDDDKDCAREIKAITSKFNSMTNEMFDVSKMDAANIKVYNSKYNIKNIFKEIVTMYNSKCKDKNLEFRVNIDHDVPEILYGDSINLKEVLTTIMDNSVKYTKDGFIEFDVNAIIKNDVCRLIITVEDSGTGIKSEDINKLKTENKSLNKANKLITLMNGTMMISSNYGMGTKVKIVLDQKIELNKNEDVLKYEEVYDDIKLLMVDDSDSGIKIIDKLIRGSNIKMDFATNGKECIDKIKAYDKYDIILLDEQLSQISAIELIKKIKSIRNFNIPVILLTKDNSYEYNDEFKDLGFSDYLLKPVKKEELLNKINEFMKKDR